VLNSFGRFRRDVEVPWDEVDSDLMIEYETYLKSRGVCPNTSSYYMRGLRAIYNRAVEKGMTVQRDPFKYVYTGIGKTVKRAVPLKVIRRIRDMDLALFPAMDFARDIFMFSFYTRGMSFIDMAYLKKKDLQNGILSYRRQKTGQQLFVKWEKPMQEIVDKYDTVSTPYLLPVIKDMNADARRQYKNAAHLVNDKLKKLGVRLGLDIPLTSYVARHGWASIARSRNIPLATISEAMGHDSEKTTRIYLASLDTSSVDKANSQILKAL
ncbi:tyrosine-type recombinase/integrase, partial [Enterobacter hormaechei]|nr:tyrosine-type recombinase/integrase [Enterobacter hormaechei]